MGVTRKVFVLVAGLAFGSAAFVGCVGDDAPPAATTTPNDAGGTQQPGQDSATPAEDAGGGTDSASPPMDAGGDVIERFDGGTPAWTATAPVGTVVEHPGPGGSPTKCVFAMLTVQTSPAPPKWDVVLRKADEAGGTCNEPKGYRMLGSTYNDPGVALLKPQGLDRLVIAYTQKATPSGSAPNQLFVKQVDWYSGNDMHLALMKTKDIQGQPVTPSLGLTSMFFGDPSEALAGTIRVKGTGTFPGATGTGSVFNAVYLKFMADNAQAASAADSATQTAN